eukprot:GHVN01015317.1.p1 GENE.GHVN01015317.1~~GHVN01015317.1.p1  ORF type:complete len:500 (+),score=47.30 GHVN01015317.1:220-1719(+)
MASGVPRTIDSMYGNRRFICLLGLLEVIIIIVYFLKTVYSPDIFLSLSDARLMQYYTFYKDVHVMVFVGFGFLMTFLKRYGMSAVAFTLFIAAFTVQLHALVGPLMVAIVKKIAEGYQFADVPVDIVTLLYGDFAAAAVLISFGALLGKCSPFQLLWITVWEVFFVSLNEAVVLQMKVADAGGSMVVHLFGAYFGLIAAVFVKPKGGLRNNEASYRSDLYAMIGTLFLWCYWPAFNSAGAGETGRHRSIINTIIALTGSVTVTFLLSPMLRRAPPKAWQKEGVTGGFGQSGFNMVDAQNATLAGGVAVGAVANMNIQPGGALVVGMAGGAISVLGFTYLQPLLERVGIHDSCGVHNLHGLPAWVSGFASITCSGIRVFNVGCDPSITANCYSTIDSFYAIWPQGNGDPLATRSAGDQAGWQAAFMFYSLALALIGGALAGVTAKYIDLPALEETEPFDDLEYWDVEEEDEIHGGSDDKRLNITLGGNNKSEMIQDVVVG